MSFQLLAVVAKSHQHQHRLSYSFTVLLVVFSIFMVWFMAGLDCMSFYDCDNCTGGLDDHDLVMWSDTPFLLDLQHGNGDLLKWGPQNHWFSHKESAFYLNDVGVSWCPPFLHLLQKFPAHHHITTTHHDMVTPRSCWRDGLCILVHPSCIAMRKEIHHANHLVQVAKRGKAKKNTREELIAVTSRN